MEQNVEFPVGGGLQDFRTGLSSSSSYFPAAVPEALDEPGQGVFRTFPQHEKSAKSGSHSTQRVPIHAGSSAACSSQGVGHDLG